MTRTGLPPLPVLNFRTTGLPANEAFATWRELMGLLFTIEQARYTSVLPRGNLTVFVVGEIMVNRCTFNAQHLTRDPALIAATPNHLVLQYYRSGGFRGTIAEKPVCIMRGQVAVCDLGQETDAYAASSDTIGLSVPRSLLEGIDPAALRSQLDASRNRLLGGYMSTLPKRLRQMDEGDIPALTDEIKRLLRRVFSHRDSSDRDRDLGDRDLGDRDLADDDGAINPDETLLSNALGLIEAHLATPTLSPTLMTERLGASRGTLYRVFAPMGGVMRYIQERRLLAVREVLNDPLDGRSLAQIAAEHGFTSQALLSRGFRARFGVSPRDWRQQQAERDLAGREHSPDPVHGLWRDLGGGTSRSRGRGR